MTVLDVWEGGDEPIPTTEKELGRLSNSYSVPH
jgi:hypothetical protein